MRNLLRFLILALAVSATAQTPAPVTPAGSATGPDDPIKKIIRTHHIRPQDVIAVLTAKQQPVTTATVNQVRTDVQLGASSGSSQTSSIIEKPGIADLLSIAIDRGAITKTSSGTGVTLSTTPYAVITGFGAADTPDLYDREVFARNLSISGTFSSSTATSGDFSSFTSGELKYVVLGNRSPRDGKLIDGVRAELADVFLKADDRFFTSCTLTDKPPVSNAIDDINKDLAGETDLTPERVHAIIDRRIASLSPDRVELQACSTALSASNQAMGGALDLLSTATRNYLANNPRQLSIATLYVRDKTLSDYYSAKVLFAYDLNQWTASLNGAVDWNRNHMTAGGVRLRTVRDYSVEAGANTKTMTNGKMDYSFSAKWSRDKDASSKSVILGEAKANIHVNTVLRLPVGVSFSNRETQTVRKGWQLNIGLSALLDDILSPPKKS